MMIWPTHDYLWDYPADLVPLLILAIAPIPSRAWLWVLLQIHGRGDSTGTEPGQAVRNRSPLQWLEK